jgi:hypothetical protein
VAAIDRLHHACDQRDRCRRELVALDARTAV